MKRISLISILILIILTINLSSALSDDYPDYELYHGYWTPAIGFFEPFFTVAR